MAVSVTLLLQTLVHASIWVGALWIWGIVGPATAAWLSLIWHFVSPDCADQVIKLTRIGFLSRRGAVIVTGAGRGLGKAAVVSLIRDGYHVIATVRDLRQADGLAKQVAAPERFHAVAMDVASDESVRAGNDKIKALLKQASLSLVGLINNAGVATHAPVEAVSISELDRVRNINVDGIVRCVQAFLPLLRGSASMSPRILNISSVAGFAGSPFTGAYGSSKFAVEGLTDALRREIASQGIGVVCVEPGFVESDMPGMLSSGAGLQEALSAIASSGLSDVYDRECTTALSAGDVMYQRGMVPAHCFGDLCSFIMTVNGGDLHSRYLVGAGTSALRLTQRYFPDSVNDTLVHLGPWLAKRSSQGKRNGKATSRTNKQQ